MGHWARDVDACFTLVHWQPLWCPVRGWSWSFSQPWVLSNSLSPSEQEWPREGTKTSAVMINKWLNYTHRITYWLNIIEWSLLRKSNFSYPFLWPLDKFVEKFVTKFVPRFVTKYQWPAIWSNLRSNEPTWIGATRYWNFKSHTVGGSLSQG